MEVLQHVAHACEGVDHATFDHMFSVSGLLQIGIEFWCELADIVQKPRELSGGGQCNGG